MRSKESKAWVDKQPNVENGKFLDVRENVTVD